MALLDLTGGRREAQAMPSRQQIDRRRQLADALMANAVRPQMSYSPLQTIATVLQGGLSGYVGSRADKADEERAKMLREILMGGTPSAAAQTTGGAMPAQAGGADTGAPVSGYTVEALAPPEGAKARGVEIETPPIVAPDTGPGMTDNLPPNATPIVDPATQGGSAGGIMANMSPQQRALIGYLLQSGNEQAAVGLVGEMLFSQPENNATSAMREYELAKQQGFQGSFLDYQTALKQAGRTSITNTMNAGSSGPQFGTIPSGYMMVRTPEGGYTMQPVPGSPAEAEEAAAETQAQYKQQQKESYGNIVLDDINRVRLAAENSVLPIAGAVGSLISFVPGTGAYNVEKLLNTIKANVGFDRLQAMRDASPTGGALGAINQTELAGLQASLGNLEQSVDEPDLLYNLGRVETLYTNIIHGPPPAGITQEQWVDMHRPGGGQKKGNPDDPLGIR